MTSPNQQEPSVSSTTPKSATAADGKDREASSTGNTPNSKPNSLPFFSDPRRKRKTKTSRKAKRNKTLSALKHGVIGCLIGIVATIAVFAVVFDIGRNYNPSSQEKEPSYSLAVLQERIEQCNELATATYIYTNAEVFKDEKALFGIMDIPLLTGKDFILKFDGIIKAGVDLDKAIIKQSEDGSIAITLPRPHIVSHELDENSFEVLREHETVFSSIKINDIQQFRAEQKEAMEQRAYESGVMEDALKNARQSIQSMLEPALPEDTKIAFYQAE